MQLCECLDFKACLKLQVAEKTNDVARNTLAEMHRQGQQLERADLGMQQVPPRNRAALKPAAGGSSLLRSRFPWVLCR